MAQPLLGLLAMHVSRLDLGRVLDPSQETQRQWDVRECHVDRIMIGGTMLLQLEMRKGRKKRRRKRKEKAIIHNLQLVEVTGSCGLVTFPVTCLKKRSGNSSILPPSSTCGGD